MFIILVLPANECSNIKKKHAVHNLRILTWGPWASALCAQWTCVKMALLLRSWWLVNKESHSQFTANILFIVIVVVYWAKLRYKVFYYFKINNTINLVLIILHNKSQTIRSNLGTNPFLQFIFLFILIYFSISFSIDTRPVTYCLIWGVGIGFNF